MYIRSQNKKRISNGIVSYYIKRVSEGGRTVEFFDTTTQRMTTRLVDEVVNYHVVMENEEIHLPDYTGITIGKYSTEEKAMKILNDIGRTLWESGHNIFNMPEDKTNEEEMDNVNIVGY